LYYYGPSKITVQHTLFQVNFCNEILNKSCYMTVVTSAVRLNDGGELWVETETLLKELAGGQADMVIGHYQKGRLIC
jgi:hypothetical protein